MNKSYVSEGTFFRGFFWGVVLSIPLWLSFFGWVKVIINFISKSQQ